MFSRLQSRFLLMNMVTISVLMLVSFFSIYTITYQNVKRDIDMELRRVADFYRKGDSGTGRPLQGKDGEPHLPNGVREGTPPPERSVSFSLRADASWKVVRTDSRFDMSEDFYAEAVAIAAADPLESGRFTLDGTRWAYSVQQAPDGHMIVYLDVTAEQRILTNLVYTFAAVALIMLAVIYAISRYFASRSIAPVREAFEKQKRFIADASHEIKTPLTVINTNADVLLANESDSIASQAKWLHHIKSETERMKTLTNDLLYLTEMDDAKTRTRTIHVPFDMSEAVESVILTMEAVIYEKNLTLDYHIDSGLMVLGSREQIKQVTMILLDNAVKYTNRKGTITVTLNKHQSNAVLSVSNTGPGIAAAHLNKIFDRFYRTDASRSRKQGGYGLGLAIAKSITELHRGKIQVRSVPEENTTFTVTLPAEGKK